MRSPCCLLLCLASLPALSAQEPLPIDQAGAHVAGDHPGTMQYVVMFRERDFDLTRFRNAVLAHRPAAEVEQIVAELERSAARHQQPFTTAVERAGGRVFARWWLINGCAIEVAPDQVEGLLQRGEVASILPNRATMPLIVTATNAANHNSDAANAAGATGFGVTVAIMDTGLDALHASTGRPHPTFYINGDINNHSGPGLDGSRLLDNVQVGSVAPDNTHPHGTGVASISAGFKWSPAANHDSGHAFDASVVGYCISNSAGSGGSSEATMASAWQRIAADRVKYNIGVANNSYSGTSCTVTDMIQMALDAAAYNADIVICVAAGNGGTSTTFSQSTANGLAVAATNPTSKTMASFSARGPLSCDPARFWPDISACGVSTVMAQVDNATGQYVASGTSMAAPQVAGGAALVRGVNPSLNAQETKAILLCTTESIAAQNPSGTRYNYGQGFLRDDLAVALAQVPGAAFTREMPNTTAVHRYTLTVVPSAPQRVVLSWPRRLGSSLSSQWSNLSLTVLDGTTTLGTSNDPNQLYEVVRFNGPASGTVTVEVRASLLEGGQPIAYSVAHTGTLANYVGGSFAPFGSACAGSAGTPAIGGLGVPTAGAQFRLTLAGARANTGAVLALGGSNTQWGSIPLPAPIPNTTCFVNVSLDVLLPAATNARGEAMFVLPIPAAPYLVGARFFTQWLIVDSFQGAGIVTTQGAGAQIGGTP
jgi:subtilisin family serine protease